MASVHSFDVTREWRATDAHVTFQAQPSLDTRTVPDLESYGPQRLLEAWTGPE